MVDRSISLANDERVDDYIVPLPQRPRGHHEREEIFSELKNKETDFSRLNRAAVYMNSEQL